MLAILAARGKPSTKLPRGRLLSRCIFMRIDAVSRISRLRMGLFRWIAEAAVFLQVNCRSRCMSKKWTHRNTTCTRKNTCQIRTQTFLKLIIWSSRHAQNDPNRKTKLRWKILENLNVRICSWKSWSDWFIYNYIFRYDFSIFRSSPGDRHLLLGMS